MMTQRKMCFLNQALALTKLLYRMTFRFMYMRLMMMKTQTAWRKFIKDTIRIKSSKIKENRKN